MANLHGLTHQVADSYSVIDSSTVENLDDRYLRVSSGGAKGDRGDDGVNGTDGTNGAKGAKGELGVGTKGAKGEEATGGAIDASDQTWIDNAQFDSQTQALRVESLLYDLTQMELSEPKTVVGRTRSLLTHARFQT